MIGYGAWSCAAVAAHRVRWLTNSDLLEANLPHRDWKSRFAVKTSRTDSLRQRERLPKFVSVVAERFEAREVRLAFSRAM